MWIINYNHIRVIILKMKLSDMTQVRTFNWFFLCKSLQFQRVK